MVSQKVEEPVTQAPKSNIIIMGGNPKPVAEEVKPEPVVAAKKPRAFVDESDIFDFSGLQKNLPAKEEKLTIMKNVSASNKSESNNSSKKITEMQNDNFGNLFLGKSQGKPVDLGAKKLDIDFGADDFFNQFDPSAVKKEVKKPVAEPKKIETSSAFPDNMIKFGSNTPVVEEKQKSNLDEYNSKK